MTRVRGRFIHDIISCQLDVSLEENTLPLCNAGSLAHKRHSVAKPISLNVAAGHYFSVKIIKVCDQSGMTSNRKTCSLCVPPCNDYINNKRANPVYKNHAR